MSDRQVPRTSQRAVLRTILTAALALGVLGPARGALASPRPQADAYSVRSPNGHVELTFALRDGRPSYAVRYDGVEVVRPSRLGLAFKDAAPLDHDFAVAAHDLRRVDTTWTQPWGEDARIRDHHAELHVTLREQDGGRRSLGLRFRVFDDGVGLRYEVGSQRGLAGRVQIMDEETEFKLAGDYEAWWIKANTEPSYELLYTHSPVSTIPLVHAPLTMKAAPDLYVSIYEAALLNYASMALSNVGDHTLKAELIPWSDGVKVKTRTPFRSPWRTIMLAHTAGGLIESHLALNLNEPNRIGDTSWIKPAKYVGIWWEMHRRLASWGSGPAHGATTANMRRFIDFAARYGFGDVLVEGWNQGWDGNWRNNRDKFDFVHPYPDFDLPGLAAYARQRRVGIILQNETAGGYPNYARQLEAAYRLYHKLGVPAVKTGTVAFGQDIDRIDDAGRPHKEWHGGQYNVEFTQHLLEVAAKNKLMLITHEPVLEPGLRRTYPNLMSQEGARGQEQNARGFGGGNPPSHTVTLPFTRMLAGPFDYTPGIIDLLYKNSQDPKVPNPFQPPLGAPAGPPPPPARVNSTVAKELALYLLIYSPLEMAADLPPSYEGAPAFQFIRDVPTDWDRTRVLNGEIGEYVTIARKQRGRDAWFIGSATDEQPREFELPLSFLTPGKTYVADIYRDTRDADWKTNPLALEIVHMKVDAKSVLHVRLAAGGGQAIRIHPAANAAR